MSGFSFQRLLPPLLPLVVGIPLLEFLCQRAIIPSYILPAPSEVGASLKADQSEFLIALTQTFEAASLGLLLSIVFGVLIALTLSSSKFIEKAFYPYAVLFQTVPIISIAPLLVIWFGFGLPTVIVSAFIVSIFPIIANTLAGMNATKTELLDLFKLYEASRWDRLTKLKLPSAVPQIVTGIRIASGLAMIGAIVGEFISGGGLGGMIDVARTQQRLDKVFAAILIASTLGILLVSLLNGLSRILLGRWRKLS